jgi:hypothetical protein
MDLQLEPIHADDDDQRDQQESEGRDLPAAPPEQHAEPDPEEGTEQDEVREVPDVTDVCRYPSDANQLEEQNRATGEEEPGLIALDERLG